MGTDDGRALRRFFLLFSSGAVRLEAQPSADRSDQFAKLSFRHVLCLGYSQTIGPAQLGMVAKNVFDNGEVVRRVADSARWFLFERTVGAYSIAGDRRVGRSVNEPDDKDARRWRPRPGARGDTLYEAKRRLRSEAAS